MKKGVDIARFVPCDAGNTPGILGVETLLRTKLLLKPFQVCLFARPGRFIPARISSVTGWSEHLEEYTHENAAFEAQLDSDFLPTIVHSSVRKSTRHVISHYEDVGFGTDFKRSGKVAWRCPFRNGQAIHNKVSAQHFDPECSRHSVDLTPELSCERIIPKWQRAKRAATVRQTAHQLQRELGTGLRKINLSFACD